MNREVVIVQAKRTPMGAFGGSLKNTSAVDLGAYAVKEAMADINLDPSLVDELIFGNVLSAGF